MKILFSTGEVHPFSKTGGLADVSASLPKAITQLKHKVKVITPMYRSCKNWLDKMKFVGEVQIEMGNFHQLAKYYSLNHEGTEHIFVSNDHYFDRETFYGHHDDAERYVFFNKAVLEFIKLSKFIPDIIHINDWQSGLIPFFIDEKYRHIEEYKNIKTLLSIHNLEYQGSFDQGVDKFFNTHFNYTYIHFDRINFLKAAIMRANAINTVSPNYRNEILTRFYGFTLDGALKSRENSLYGILNGIDYDINNPQTDKYLVRHYNQNYFIMGKRANKKMVCEKLGLNYQQDAPMVAFIGRLARQKGIDLMKATLEEVIVNNNAIFVLVGSGDPEYENFFRYLENKYRGKVCGYVGFNNEIAHQVYAASDLFMMPSLFEPCGLGQMIAMRYGSLPVVRETGGLKDTVMPYNKYTDKGVGFSFANYNAHEFKDAVERAIDLYHNNQTAWRNMVKRAMKQDNSLNRMAHEYINLYQKIIKGEH
ncbi:MAG: glycogen synthase [Acholeplasmataceae bacterium]|jgi:starch synthase